MTLTRVTHRGDRRLPISMQRRNTSVGWSYFGKCARLAQKPTGYFCVSAA